MSGGSWRADETEGVLEIWPPTEVRPSEIRIAQLNRNFPRGRPKDDRSSSSSRTLDGQIWGYYTTEAELRREEWDDRIQGPILACIAQTPDTRSVRGFIDISAGQTHCHG